MKAGKLCYIQEIAEGLQDCIDGASVRVLGRWQKHNSFDFEKNWKKLKKAGKKTEKSRKKAEKS